MMPEIVRNNLALKILSIIGALVIWAAVRMQIDPIQERQLDVRVLASPAPEGMTVMRIEPEDIEVTMRGRRSVFEQHGPDYVKLYADVSQAKVGVQSVPLKAQQLRGGLELLSLSRQRTIAELDTLITRSRPVQAHTRGRAAAGFAARALQVEENEVKVSGAASDVHRVARVAAVVDISGLNSKLTRAIPVQARDENDLLVESVTINPPKVIVTVPIVRVDTKTVPIQPQIRNVPTGWQISDVQSEPATVTLTAASGEALANVRSVRTDIVDISGLRGKRSYTVALQVPAGISAVGAASAQVTVTLGRLEVSQPGPARASDSTASDTSSGRAGAETEDTTRPSTASSERTEPGPSRPAREAKPDDKQPATPGSEDKPEKKPDQPAQPDTDTPATDKPKPKPPGTDTEG